MYALQVDYRDRDRLTWERIFRDADPGWLAVPPSPVMDRAAAFFRLSGARRILDAGSGFGRWGVFLAETLGSGVTGLDYAMGGARMAQELVAGRDLPVTFLAGELTALPFKPRSFDGILAVLVLDNLERDHARIAVEELMRVARPACALFAVFNPIERPESCGKNPTASCHGEKYTMEEIGRLLRGWRIASGTTVENSLRAVEATLIS